VETRTTAVEPDAPESYLKMHNEDLAFKNVKAGIKKG